MVIYKDKYDLSIKCVPARAHENIFTKISNSMFLRLRINWTQLSQEPTSVAQVWQIDMTWKEECLMRDTEKLQEKY